MSNSFFNLANYFYSVCEKHKSQISIKYKDEEINYDQLNKLSNQVANYFLSKGIKSYDVVGIFNTKEVFGYKKSVLYLRILVIL